MTGVEALNKIQKKINNAIRQGKKPNKVLIPSEYENALITLETNNSLKEKISTKGVRVAFPKINGIETEWDAEKLDLEFESDAN